MNIIGDFFKNMLSPYYLIFDVADETYHYSLLMMEGEHYLFADFYALYFNIMFVLINVYTIINKSKPKIEDGKGIMIIIMYALVSAGFFSLLTGFNFHIRYVLPVYIIEIAIITVLFNGNSQEQERMKRYGRKSNN